MEGTHLTPTKSPDDTEIDTPPHTTHPFNNHNHRHLRRDDDNDNEHHQTTAVAVIYKECMKNHAAAIGGHAVDGCGEFTPSPSSSATDPTSLKCAACGCHRNFHRQDPDSAITPPFLDFRHPPLPKRFSISPSPSPPPPVPFPPQVFFGAAAPVTPTVENPVGRKRFRTKFSQDQKEKMHWFSEKVDWKMQKCDEAAVREFCREIGVSKGVLKVWMHNNKNTFGNKKETMSGGGGNGRSISFESAGGDGRKISNGNNGNGNGVHLHASSSSPSPSPA